MEFIPRKAAAVRTAQAVETGPALDARQRSLRAIGVAAVAAALGLAEGAKAHAEHAAPMPLPLPKAA